MGAVRSYWIGNSPFDIEMPTFQNERRGKSLKKG
jgi:hypothetical protein